MAMPAAFVIAGKDLRLRFRDRSAIVIGFVAPLVIAGLMSLAFRGTEHFHITVAVVDRDHGPVAASFLSVLRSPDLHKLVTVHDEPTVAAASASVRGQHADAGIVIPPGFSQATTTNAATSIQLLTSVDSNLAGQVARSIVQSFASQVDAARLSVATAIVAGAHGDRVAALAARAAQARPPEAAALQPVGAHPLTAISYYAPGMAIFFALFGVSAAASSFFGERTEGTLDRVVAAPISPVSVLAGKALSVFVFCVTSLFTMAIVTSLFFGAKWGGPLPVAVLCIAMAIAIVCLGAFVIVMARTQRQAEGLASMVVFGLALLGGNFLFISSAPAYLRKLALATPNGWALRGFSDMATGTGAHAVIVPTISILAFSVVLGGIAAVFARRAVLR